MVYRFPWSASLSRNLAGRANLTRRRKLNDDRVLNFLLPLGPEHPMRLQRLCLLLNVSKPHSLQVTCLIPYQHGPGFTTKIHALQTCLRRPGRPHTM